MKYKITVETDDEFERQAVIDAVKNKVLLDGLYDAIFRPVIKYGNNDDEAELCLSLWEKVEEYLNK